MAEIVKRDCAKWEKGELADLAGDMRRFASEMRRDDSDARESIRAPYADHLDGFADAVEELCAMLTLYGRHSVNCARPLKPDCDCGWDKHSAKFKI